MTTPDGFADAEKLVADIWREYLTPPPAVAPGRELQHLVDAVDGLRMQLKILQASVDALQAEVRHK